MLEVRCKIPNFANFCVQKSKYSKFYPSSKTEKKVPEKTREDIPGGPSFAFTRKAVVNETFIRKSSSLYKSIVGQHASQPNP